MYKGYKVRIFPTPEQEEQLWQHIHACRFIWNYMLNLQEQNYADNKPFMYRFDMINYLTKLKKTTGYEWLGLVSRDSLNRTCTDLSLAYKLFFKKTRGHPHFKSRKNTRKYAYPICDLVGRFYLMPDYAKVQKIGRIKIKTNLDIPYGNKNKYSNPRISNIHGKWILTFELEYENQVFHDSNDNPMGIDLGIKNLATVAYQGETIIFPNINKSQRVRKLSHKLNHLYKVLMRKYRCNGNYERTNGVIKCLHQIRNVEYRLSCIRKNYIHQTTHKLITMKPSVVIMETLDIAEMMRNKYTALPIREMCLGEFLRQMEYKCLYNGINFIQADMYYPSSKTCSNCGNIKRGLSVSDRRYYCCECGLTIDRDENAAINLMRYMDHTKRSMA